MSTNLPAAENGIVQDGLPTLPPTTDPDTVVATGLRIVATGVERPVSM